jgi:hypothetical protein
MGCGQIHTSVQAGGMTSARIRARTSGSVTRVPCGSRYTKPRPLRRRRSPGAAGSDRLSLGMTTVAFPRDASDEPRPFRASRFA